MSWQTRLGEMVLAGGALATAACSSRSLPALEDAGPTDGTTVDGADASSDVLMNFDQNGCCNAATDPCCAYENCGASLTMDCACVMEGGTWNYGTPTNGGPYCSFGGDAGDAGIADSGAGDTGQD